MMPRSTTYPSSLIVPPLLEPHKNTFIVLHGRGSNAEKFSGPLLSHPVTTPSASAAPQTIPFQERFPNVKFVFPTASSRRATAFNRSIIHQWYDILPSPSNLPEALSPSHPDRVERRGLGESAVYLHNLIREEAKELDGDFGRVVVMGLSQGCATMLAAIISWEGPKLGAVVGMCGWLPMREGVIDTIALDRPQDEDADVFDRHIESRSDSTKLEIAAGYMREELGIAHAKDCHLGLKNTPVFLGHGVDDEKVPRRLGAEAADILHAMEVEVTFRSYENLGHWYSSNMLSDIDVFIHRIEDMKTTQ